MPLRDLVDDLIDNLDATRRQLDTLRAGMEGSRRAYLGMRASEIDAAVTELNELAADVLKTGAARERILDALRAELRLAGPITVSRLLPQVPRGAAAALRRAAGATGAGARAASSEARLGGRLLQLSRQSFEGMMRSLVDQAEPSHRSYDHHARTIDSSSAGGSLVRGTL